MTQRYRIRFKGHLDPDWSAWFDGLTITHEASGETLLAGPLPNQAALYGILEKARKLDLTLVCAEAIRWLEWSLRSYHSVMLGLSLVLFATVIVGTARMSRPIGYLVGLSGLAYIGQGWVLGVEGFSGSNMIPTLLGIVSVLAWSIWYVISAWRMQEMAGPPAG